MERATFPLERFDHWCDGGRWQGRQIVSESWIREIQKKRFDISGANPFASGNGGNVLFVVPGERMVVSLTSSGYGQGYGHQRAHDVFGLILKALVAQTKKDMDCR